MIEESKEETKEDLLTQTKNKAKGTMKDAYIDYAKEKVGIQTSNSPKGVDRKIADAFVKYSVEDPQVQAKARRVLIKALMEEEKASKK